MVFNYENGMMDSFHLLLYIQPVICRTETSDLICGDRIIMFPNLILL